MRTLDQMIAQEVHYCVSALVSTLAQGIASDSVMEAIYAEAMA